MGLLTTWFTILLRKRASDKPETVKKRLQVYHEQTQPLIDHYEKKGALLTVDGTQDIKVVFEDITKVLDK